MTAITPGVARPFAEVAGEIKVEIARERAKKSVQVLHDKIEDQRALGQIARGSGESCGRVPTRGTIDAIDERASIATACPLRISAAPADLVAARRLRLRQRRRQRTISTRDNGYVWSEVQKVWICGASAFVRRGEGQGRSRLARRHHRQAPADKAAELVKKLRDGGQLSKIAADEKLELKHNSNASRTGADGFEPQAIVAVFNQPNHGAGSANAPGGRMVFQIFDTATPEFNPILKPIETWRSN
ncbi:MAG: hypothetical protein U1E30_05110 [Rhodoblastus sp.]